MSSANSLIEQPILLTISFIYIKNNKGAKIDPCGTPALTGAQSDEAPFNTTRCKIKMRKSADPDDKARYAPSHRDMHHSIRFQFALVG